MKFLRIAFLIGIVSMLPAFALAVTFVLETPIAGDVVPVTLEIVDAAGGNGVDFNVSVPAGEGDILGLFGNLVNESLVNQLVVENSSGILTQSQFRANKVFKVGSGNTMSPVKKWDWGLRIGESGSAGGAVEFASFGLRAPGLNAEGVINAVNQGWVFGVRVQSTTGPEGSSKMGLGDGESPVGLGPPTILIDQPSDGTITNQSSVTVVGATTGENVVVDVNGISAGVTGNGYSAAVGLVEGVNTLVATATNAGGTATDQVDVVLDTTPPIVSISVPADGAISTANLILVEGTVSDLNPISTFQINGTDVPLVNGTFETTLTLPLDQLFAIDAVAIDAAGNAGNDLVSVTYGLAPTVIIESPADAARTASGSVIVNGSVVGSGAPIVTVSGISAVVTGERFVATVPLGVGENLLTASASTVFGSASDAVNVFRGELPTVQIDSPGTGERTSQTPLVVRGVVTGEPTPTVSVNGVSASIAAGVFTASIPLFEGLNTLAATAINEFGESASNISIDLDTTPPLVLIGSPTNGAEFEVDTISVSGGVIDASPIVALSLNGTPITPGTNYAETIDLVEGENVVTVSATDAVGLEGSAQVAVTRLIPSQLEIEIETPPEGVLLSTESVDVAGSVNDPNASVSVNGVSATVTGAQWVAAAVPLVEGSNTLVAIATLGSQTAEDQVSVLFNAPPEVVILTPGNGDVLSSPETDIEGTVDDVTALVSVNGVVATVDSGGRFIAAGVPVEIGPNLFAARAVDPLGAVGRDEVNVTRDDDVPGQIRIVMLDQFREALVANDVSNLFRFVPIVADDLASFEAELEERQFLIPSLFTPAVSQVMQATASRIVTSRTPTPLYLYVFVSMGEVGQEVSLQGFSPNTEFDDMFSVLQPIDGLSADLQLLGLDSSLVERLLPGDFEANGFARFDIPISCLDGDGGGFPEG